MKKSVIITTGVVLILIVLGIWGYLLFFGTPADSDEVFANLGIGDGPGAPSPAPQETPTPRQEPVTQVDTQGEALRQLTTKPVAGFAYMGSSSDSIRYVERGTGHVFEIGLANGQERRVSGTTIPNVVDAVFSPEGSTVALVSEDGYTRKIVAGSLNGSDEQVDFISLPNNAFEPSFATEYRVRYGVRTDTGVEGYELDVRDSQPLRLFSIPLRDISILWEDNTYVYNRPARAQLGALYVVDGGLAPVTSAAYGLVAGMSSGHYFETHVEGEDLVSAAISRSSGERRGLAIDYIPEKCAVSTAATSSMWCAAPLEEYGDSFLEDWYKGTVRSEDLLWRVDILRGQAQLSANFLEQSGRMIDVDQLLAGPRDETVLLRNRLDNTLWLYDSTVD